MADPLSCPALDTPALVCAPGVLDPDTGAVLPAFDRLERAFFGMLAQWPPEAIEDIRLGPWRTIRQKPDQFIEAMLAAYSDHVLDSLRAAFEWIAEIADQLIAIPTATACLAHSSMQQLATFVFAPETSGSVVSDLVEACPDVAPLLDAFDAVSAYVAELYASIASLDSEDLGNAVTFVEELLLSGAELLAQPELKVAMTAFVEDPAALGRFVGTVAGVLMWELISSVLTLGLNKVKALGRIGTALATITEIGL